MSRAAAALLVALLSCGPSDTSPRDPDVPVTVIPRTTCQDPLSVWTILVAADGRSAEARENGQPTQFGVMACGEPSAPLNASFFRTCGSPHVADAGYRAFLSRTSDGGIDVQLQAETMAGPHNLAALSCRDLAAAPTAGQPLPFDPNDWALEYSTSGGVFPYVRSLTLRQDGQFTIVDSKLGEKLTTRVRDELTSRIAAFLKTAREHHAAPLPGADRIDSTLVVTSLGRKHELPWSPELARLFSEAADAGVRNRLVGSWYQSVWKLCTPVAQLGPDDIDPPIEVLELGADRTFSVRWRDGAPTADVPGGMIPDYGGTYVITPATGEISFWPEGSSEPRDFSGKGTFSVTDDTVTIHGIWFGTKPAIHKPDICELTFARRSS